MIMISNQAAVGKGLLTPSALEELTVQMNQALIEFGASLTAVYYCTHRREEQCACRKPQPGLLYQAASDFHLDLARSIFIGDSDTDIQAAWSAGCQPVLFGPGITSGAGSSDWAKGLPVALTAKELFQVATDSLRVADRTASGGRASSVRSTEPECPPAIGSQSL
jgi:HAD superfamily hydrolase (TIGR01662 family)